MWFNILTGNHGNYQTVLPLAPIINYLRGMLSVCGHSVTITHGQLAADATNLFIEAFHDDEYLSVILNAREKYQLKIGIVATELMIDGVIPYAKHGMVYHGVDKNPLIDARIRNFEQLAPIVDFVWCFLERTAISYRHMGPHIHYLPVGHVTPVPRELRRSPKDFDVVFFGTTTPHRMETLARFERFGINVHKIGRGFEDGWVPQTHLESLMDRAKIGLNLTLHAYKPREETIDPRFVSSMRVCDMLERDMCVLSEIIPLDNPYSEYMHMVEADRLARRCRELLDGNKWQETALQKAELFRQQMDVRAICAPVIEATVKAMGG